MKFVDEAFITVKAGDGGSGSRSFRREKFVPYGGPDGGNGGPGGSIILVADPSVHTLLDFRFRPLWQADDGQPGASSRKDGKAGEDLRIAVPVGTQIFKKTDSENFEADDLVADLHVLEMEFILAQGGRGGKGNNFFKTSTNQAPEYVQPGESGDGGEYVLSLKLVADVGLLGLPNAGKSTLISRISSARPKIADYPFTTLVPNLGVVFVGAGASFVVADIPGLIPGASEGKGLGIRFLKHVERTRILVHLIDMTPVDDDGNPRDPLDAFNAINQELHAFSPELAQRKQLIALTKVDALPDRTEITKAIDAFRRLQYAPIIISSVSGEGVNTLINEIWTTLRS